MLYDFLKEMENKQYQTGRVNADSKTKQMGKDAHEELKKYPVDDNFTPFN